jgi:hypothetical protein
MKEFVPVVAAVLAAVAAVLGYLLNARIGRLRERERYFAEALLATEQYKQLAHLRHRLDDPEEAAKKISEVHEKLAYHRRWLQLNSPAVAARYRTLVIHLRNKEFFRPDGVFEGYGKDVIELNVKTHSQSKVWRDACIEAMDHELSILRFWVPRHRGEDAGADPKLFTKMSDEEQEAARKFYYPEEYAGAADKSV